MNHGYTKIEELFAIARKKKYVVGIWRSKESEKWFAAMYVPTPEVIIYTRCYSSYERLMHSVIRLSKKYNVSFAVNYVQKI